MSETNWEKKKKIFAAALAVSNDEIAGFLERECAGDFDLKSELEHLLDSHFAGESFIERPVFEIASILAESDAPKNGKRFGRYSIVREIGRGGMGTVFLAERNDGEFAQTVALKIVRQSIAGNETARRFRRERQILASLNHPNIAKLLDGGVSDSDELFLVMEYIEGVRIDEFCAANDLVIEKRLKLFLHVCRAVAFAHQNLVVHRDLKPSNILVTKAGEPKLLDFGIAKLLDAEKGSEQTRTEYRAFTPEYAAPEQISGAAITTASDVFSLGVLLAKITENSETNGGKKNFAQTAGTEKRKSKSELHAIIQMARREEPARRYPSVQQFAEDIQRYLDGLPVRAQKDSFVYRAKKFVSRNKLGVAAASLILFSLIAGLAVALWQANVARAERDRAQRRFADVRRLSNSLLFELSPRIERLPGSIEAREILVSRALEYLDSLAEESQDDVQLQSELASAYEKIGNLQGNPSKPNLSDFRGAIASLEKARTIRRVLLEKQSGDADNKLRFAEDAGSLSKIYFTMNDVASSISESETALNIYEDLIAASPESIDLRLARAEAELDLAFTYIFNDRNAESYPYLQKSLSALEELDREKTPNSDVPRLLARGYAERAYALSWDGNQPEAETEMTRALRLIESLAADKSNDAVIQQDYLRILNYTSSIYEDINNELSLQFSRKALAVAENAALLDAANAQARQNLARAYSRVGVLENYLKREREAVKHLKKSQEILTDLEKNEPQNTTYIIDIARNFQQFGIAEFQTEDFQGSISEYEKSATLYKKVIQSDENNTAITRNLAVSYKYIGDSFLAASKRAVGEKRFANRQAAKENYERAAEILLELKSKNMLPKYDEKSLDKIQAAALAIKSEK